MFSIMYLTPRGRLKIKYFETCTEACGRAKILSREGFNSKEQLIATYCYGEEAKGCTAM